MGWLYSERSRDQLIAHLTESFELADIERKTVVHELREENGYAVLWSVVQMTTKKDGVIRNMRQGQTQHIINCDLIDCRDGKTGYKSLTESAGPYYFSCPLSFLDMAPEQNSAWRKAVRAWHEKREESQ